MSERIAKSIDSLGPLFGSYVLGIDPGLTRTGFALVRVSPEGERTLEWGFVLDMSKLGAGRKKTLRQASVDTGRCALIAESVRTIFRQGPLIFGVFVEEPSGSQSARALKFMNLAYASAYVASLMIRPGLLVETIPAREIKSFFGNTDKKKRIAEVREMAPDCVGWTNTLGRDEHLADAFLCVLSAGDSQILKIAADKALEYLRK